MWFQIINHLAGDPLEAPQGPPGVPGRTLRTSALWCSLYYAVYEEDQYHILSTIICRTVVYVHNYLLTSLALLLNFTPQVPKIIASCSTPYNMLFFSGLLVSGQPYCSWSPETSAIDIRH